MIKRGFVVTAWVVVGHAMLGALYWLLLQIPESNVLMLAASLLVVLAAVGGTGLVEATALAGLRSGTGPAAALAVGIRRAAWVVGPILVFSALWWGTGFCGDWLGAMRGEIDAWFIATFGWTEAQGVHTALGWLLWFVRYPVAVALAVSLMASITDAGLGGIRTATWLARAFHWRTLVVLTAALFVGFYLTWEYVVPWRPASLPVSWVQPAFAAVKLAAVFIVMNAAWTVALACAGRTFGAVPAAPAEPVAPAAPAEPAEPTEPSAPDPSPTA